MQVLSLSIFIILCLSKGALSNSSIQKFSNKFKQKPRYNNNESCTDFTFSRRISLKFSQETKQAHFIPAIQLSEKQSVCRQCFPYVCNRDIINQKIISKCSKFVKSFQPQKIKQFSLQQINYLFLNKITQKNFNGSKNFLKVNSIYCPQIQIIWKQNGLQNRKQFFLQNIFLLELDITKETSIIVNFMYSSGKIASIIAPHQQKRMLFSQQTNNMTKIYKNLRNCQINCKQCNNEGKCIKCRSGFTQTNKQTCQPTKLFYFLNTIMGLTLNTFGCCLLFQTFINQNSFFEYHSLSFPRLEEIFQFVGGLNRQKYIPLFFRSLFSDYLELYDKRLVQIIPDIKYTYSPENFIKYERTPIHFISNTCKILIWNILIVVFIFSVLKFANTYAKKYQKYYDFLERNSSCQFLIFLIFQSQAQYYTYMFCKQIWISFCIDFEDKLNIVFCILMSFLVIIFSFGAYSVFCFMSTQRNLQLFYPNVKNHYTFQALVHKFVDGQGRYLLLGAIQAIEQHCAIKMFLLSLLNITSMIFCYNLNIQSSSIYKFLNKNLYMFVQFIFNLFGLMSHLQIGQYVQFHYNIQHLCILLLWMIIGMELLCYFLRYFGCFVSSCVRYWEIWTKVSPIQQNTIKIKARYGLKLKTKKDKEKLGIAV